MVVRYWPGKLGAKPDALTRCCDIYPKEGDKDFARINPDNFRPIFINEQLAASLHAMYLEALMLQASVLLDIEQLRSDILSSLPNDPVASPLISAESINDPRWTVDSEGFLLWDHHIYVPEANDLRLHILRTFHDHPTAGHFGQNRTLKLIHREYTWPNIRTFIKDYISSCTTYSCAKVPRHHLYGLLKQLPILEKPWDSISMDFIEQLPPLVNYTAILVVIDRLSKQAIFIPIHDTVTSAKLFLINVFSKHRVPAHVTSDWGSEFVSHLFCSLGKALNMHLHFTSGYCPEGDGQTEHANQTLEHYLHISCNYQQDNWSDLLPLTEFAYNNAPSATTGVSPFFANKGYHPNFSVYSNHSLTSSSTQSYIHHGFG